MAFCFFLLSIAMLVFGYGLVVGRYQIFPYKKLESIAKECREVCRQLHWFSRVGCMAYKRAPYPDRPALRNTGQACEGLNLVTELADERMWLGKIMDLDGKTLHEWNLDWFTIWPDAKHLPDKYIPKVRPGTTIHGTAVMENGDLVFNYENLGLVRLDREGKVVWRLPRQTHHSVYQHDDGTLWVCCQREHTEPDRRLPDLVPPFKEDTILVVTPEGKIVQEWSIADLLHKNNLTGLLYLVGADNKLTEQPEDMLHLNDVEPFPETLEEGFFKKGDILVSLRNISTVLVFNRETEKIKFICTGMFTWQHDPDFIDGNRFSVFDNWSISPDREGRRSRIVIVTAPEKTMEVFYEGSPEGPFHTQILGKHQWLSNGNLLITEAMWGRAFEVNRRGEIVWEYINYVDDGVVGLVMEVQRLPPKYTGLFGGSESSEPESRRPDARQEKPATTNASGD